MPSVSDRTIALGNLNIHYRHVGEEGLPPLIVLHGLGGKAEEWDHVSLAIADRYHVFALDQRGHGESSWPGDYSFELMRDDLEAFADALSFRRFTLIGHSMGGTVAYLFAEKWPERIERLVCEDTAPPSLAALPASTPGLVTTKMRMTRRRDRCPLTSRSGQTSSPSCADLIRPGGASCPRSRPQP